MRKFNVFSEQMLVNSSQAAIWLSKNNFDKQRPIRSEHVSYLALQMYQGRFMAGTQIHFAHLGKMDPDKMLLVNGQHTLSAIVKCKSPQMLTVLHTIVQSEQEVAELYFRHDSHLVRTNRDAFRALDLEEITGLNVSEQGYTGSACNLILSVFANIKSGRIPKDDLIKMIINFCVPAKLYFNAIQDCYGGYVLSHALRRASSVAMGIITFHYCRTQADDFWRILSHDESLKQKDPRKTLMIFLINNTTGGGGFTRRRQLSNPYLIRAISSCWNAYMRSQQLNNVRVNDDLAPLKIIGTPLLGMESDRIKLSELGLGPLWPEPKSKSTATPTSSSTPSNRSSSVPRISDPPGETSANIS